MATQYRIVCVEHSQCGRGGHIVRVGTGSDPGAANEQWTLTEVFAAMNRGDSFYTHADGHTAQVKPLKCGCDSWTIRSHGDVTKANNLDNLRVCSWKAG